MTSFGLTFIDHLLRILENNGKEAKELDKFEFLFLFVLLYKLQNNWEKATADLLKNKKFAFTKIGNQNILQSAIKIFCKVPTKEAKI